MDEKNINKFKKLFSKDFYTEQKNEYLSALYERTCEFYDMILQQLANLAGSDLKFLNANPELGEEVVRTELQTIAQKEKVYNTLHGHFYADKNSKKSEEYVFSYRALFCMLKDNGITIGFDKETNDKENNYKTMIQYGMPTGDKQEQMVTILLSTSLSNLKKAMKKGHKNTLVTSEEEKINNANKMSEILLMDFLEEDKKMFLRFLDEGTKDFFNDILCMIANETKKRLKDISPQDYDAFEKMEKYGGYVSRIYDIMQIRGYFNSVAREDYNVKYGIYKCSDGQKIRFSYEKLLNMFKSCGVNVGFSNNNPKKEYTELEWNLPTIEDLKNDYNEVKVSYSTYIPKLKKAIEQINNDSEFAKINGVKKLADLFSIDFYENVKVELSKSVEEGTLNLYASIWDVLLKKAQKQIKFVPPQYYDADPWSNDVPEVVASNLSLYCYIDTSAFNDHDSMYGIYKESDNTEIKFNYETLYNMFKNDNVDIAFTRYDPYKGYPKYFKGFFFVRSDTPLELPTAKDLTGENSGCVIEFRTTFGKIRELIESKNNNNLPTPEEKKKKLIK